MNNSNQIGLSITTYEYSNGTSNRTLTHIFWGDTIEDTYNIAKSHLITDYFFSGSFEGGIQWKGKFLKLDNEGKLVGQYTYSDEEDLEDILDTLLEDAEEVNGLKEETGIIQQIEFIGEQVSAPQ